MHALITGGAGSIGSRLAAALVERGDSVTVVDVRPDPVAPSAAFERADVRVGETQAAGFIEGIVAETRPDAVFTWPRSCRDGRRRTRTWPGG